MPELSSKQWSQVLALLGKLKFFIVDPRVFMVGEQRMAQW